MRSFCTHQGCRLALTVALSQLSSWGKGFVPGMLARPTALISPNFSPSRQAIVRQQNIFELGSGLSRGHLKREPMSLRAADVTEVSESEAGNDTIKPKYTHDNPRFFNSHAFRAFAAASTLYLVGYVSGIAQSPFSLIKSKQTLATIHVLAFGVWFGSIVYSTFVGGITMVKNLPRPLFAKVQSKLFPKFFKLCAGAILVELATLPGLPLFMQNNVVLKRILVTSLIATLSNMFFFGPKTTAVMKTRIELEQLNCGTSSEAYKRANGKFMKYHAGSSIANLLAMCGAVGHAMQLAFPLAS